MMKKYIDEKSCQFVLILSFCVALIFGTLSGIDKETDFVEEVLIESEQYIELEKNQSMRQEIIIQNNSEIKTDKIGICVKKEKEVSGYLQFRLIQKDKILQIENIAFPDILSEQYYDIEIRAEKIEDGTAWIELEYIGFSPEDIILIMTGTGQLNLDNIWLDGNLLNSSLAVRLTYKISELSKIAQIVEIIMKILLFVLLPLSVYFFVYTQKNKLVQLSLAGIVFLIISLRYYPLILNCQPFAEELNVYIDSALNENFIKNILVKDAGYLAVIQHLISWVYVRILHLRKYAILAMNITAVSSIAALCSLLIRRINNADFSSEKILPDWFRFCMAVAVPTALVRQLESFLFLNFIYFAIFFFLFLMESDFRTMNKRKYAACLVISFLIMLSKGYFVVFLPLSVLGSVYYFKENKKKAGWYFTIFLGALCQLGVYFICRDTTDSMQASLSIIQSNILLVVKEPFRIIGKTFLSIFMPYIEYQQLFIAIGIIYLSMMVYAYIKLCKKERQIGFYLLEIQTLLVSSVLLSMINMESMYTSSDLFFSRQEFFGIILMVYSVGILYQIGIKQGKYKIICQKIGKLYLYLLCFIWTFQLIEIDNKFQVESPNTDSFSFQTTEMVSDWDTYAGYIEDDAFYIPSNPYYWCYTKNCDIELYSNEREDVFWRTMKTYTAMWAKTVMENKQYTSFDVNPDKALKEIFVRKSSLQQKYKIQCFDEKGNLLGESIQLNDRRKNNIGFIFSEAMQGVYYIKFVDADNGKPVTIYPEIVLVYQKI